MKRLSLFLSLALIAILAGCSKNYQDALPACKFISATPYGQDSLLLVGQVTTAGASPIEYNGFAYSNQPNFDITSNQVGCPPNSEFTAVIPAYTDTAYYFKCYVANEYGYSVSSVFKYLVPAAKPDSAPCTLTTNVVDDNNTNWTMPYITYGGNASFGSFGIQASDATGNEVVNIYFNVVPTNGIYTTDGNEQDFIDNPNKFSVLMTLGASNQYLVNSGGKVYVAQEKNGSTTITFCSLTYMAFSNNFSLSGKINY